MARLKRGNWYRFNDRGRISVGQYIGCDQDFSCCVCDKGHNAKVFNVWYQNGDYKDYESWGYGPDHMPEILDDYGKSENPLMTLDRIF